MVAPASYVFPKTDISAYLLLQSSRHAPFGDYLNQEQKSSPCIWNQGIWSFQLSGMLHIKTGSRSQDGGGIGRGDHFLFYKFIERTTERWTKFTKQLLIASSGHQAPRKTAHCLRREVGQGYWRSKRETRKRGTETRPGKGLLLEEVSNHQETLALAGPGEVFKSQRAT